MGLLTVAIRQAAFLRWVQRFAICAPVFKWATENAVQIWVAHKQKTPPKVHIKHGGMEIVLDDNPTPQQIQALKDLLEIHSKDAQARDTGPASAGQQADNQTRAP
jgi:hypothetical protein